ncbi:MAG: hypothetical protein QOC81_4811 [Thermoanaerobaculia bacterium]|jgi:outer membrane receptor for ferrienterochelin and colicin|nr:hypothetical protein [Thermoanaerobaculia bacterium]
MSDRSLHSRGIPSFARKLMFVVSVVACITLAMPTTIHAQVTTGNIAGTVTDASGAALPGVTVEVTHVPTGTHYTAVSDSSGRFTVPNVRIGGPYKISGVLEGMKPAEVSGVQVNIGSTTEVPLGMRLNAVAESITVTAKPDEVINPNRTGSTSTVQEKQIQSLPTVNRNMQDFARTNPYFVVDARDDSATLLSVAGRNNRYNNIQIDGAVNNDLFGLAASGTPGGQSNASPISIDAIEQLQLVVSPYDVRQGGFTGGGINAVTRSGSNKFTGSIFGTKRNQNNVGDYVPVFVTANFAGNGTRTDTIKKPIVNFDYSQYGGRLGGPILQDKLFFFINGERNRRSQPDGTSADGSAGTTYVNAAQDIVCSNVPGCSATRLQQDLITKYSYDPGGLGDIQKETPSNLIFGRLDFNATAGNALTLRNNYVKGGNTIVSNRSGSQFRFPTSIYNQANHTSSTVAQLNSVISTGSFNEARVGYQLIKDIRSTPVQFPSIEIGGANQNATLNAGTERFSAANSLDQKITEITDDFTMLKGNHTIVVGTHNELFKFKNLFLSEFNGYYFYPRLDDFENPSNCGKNIPGRGQVNCEYRISFATGADPQRPTAFGAQQFGLYVNDQWHVSNNLTLSLGIRADKPRFNDTPSFNPLVQTALGFNTATHPAESLVISPRIGFNWNPGGGSTQQLRGGIGVFAGRAPYVWISNAYAGTGVEQVALACLNNANVALNCPVPAFNPDPANQPHSVAGALPLPLSVDLIDPNFKFPRVLRTTLGYDRDLFLGIRGTAEILYSRTQEDVYYENLNDKPNGVSVLDGRPKYSRVSTALVDSTYLTNTSKGSETTETIQLTRPFSHGITVSGNFAHQRALSAFEATSSRAISSWRFQHSQGDIFSPTLGRSAFEQRNRFSLNATYDFNTGPFGHTIGLYFNAQSGRPYSILMGGDPNTDNNASNDLLYIPGGTDKVILCPSQATTPTATNPCGTATALNSQILSDYLTFAGLDPNKARVINKYESFEPWSRKLDFHYALALPIKVMHTEVSFDMLNLMHFISKDNGNVYFVANQNVSPVTWVPDPIAGSSRVIYREASTTLSGTTRNFGSLTPGRQFSIADLSSRWQARLGFRITY